MPVKKETIPQIASPHTPPAVPPSQLELERAIEKFTALSSLASAVSRARELDPLLAEVLDTVMELFGTDLAHVMLFDPDTGDLCVRAGRGAPPEYVAAINHLRPGEGVAGRVYVSGKPLVLRDASTDPRITRDIVRKMNVHALACVPLIAGGRTLGVLVTATRDPEHRITENIELLEAIGHQLGMAIENARLFEENLRARRLWESTFNAISDGISVHTEDMRIVKANRALARILEIPPEQLVGTPCCMAMLGRETPLPDCAHRRATDGHLSHVREVIERPNGQILRITVDPLLDEEGRPYGSVHVVSDITERIAMERRIARAEQLALIGELAAGLAHEVKNPLAGIKGALEIILERLAEDDPHRKVLEHVLAETMRINRIISDLLDYARPHRPSRTRIDLNALVERVVATAQLQLPSDRVKLEFRPAADVPPLLVDPDEMQKVILNLLLNAIHAVKGEGHILITTAAGEDNRAVRLSITDTGEGIPPENVSKIFRPFFTTKKKGTGLGLATCHRIVTSYGGTITVHSEVGKGSTFTVELPTAVEPLDLSSHVQTAPPAS